VGTNVKHSDSHVSDFLNVEEQIDIGKVKKQLIPNIKS